MDRGTLEAEVDSRRTPRSARAKCPSLPLRPQQYPEQDVFIGVLPENNSLLGPHK